MNDTAVMVCGHGSRDPDAIREFQALATGLKARLPQYDLESGYLEFAKPVIQESLAKLIERGAKRILAVPGMLFAAAHVKNDLPWELNTFAAAHPGVAVNFGRELAIEPKLLKVAAERITAAELGSQADVPRVETLLMVVGRGTNDSDANSNISKVARMLWEGMGFGWAETCYSGVAHPRVDAALEKAVKLGFRKELEAVSDPAERRALFEKMVAAAYARGKALSTATYFEVDEVIDPADSRRWIATVLLEAKPRPAHSHKKRPNIDTW